MYMYIYIYIYMDLQKIRSYTYLELYKCGPAKVWSWADMELQRFELQINGYRHVWSYR